MFLLACSAAAYADNSSKRNAPGMEDIDIRTLKPLSESENVVPGAVYADPSASSEARAYDVIRRLTFEEKLRLTTGYNRFMVPGIERLGLRSVSMADASQGVRTQTSIVKDKSTSFPGMLSLASTWNPNLAGRMSATLAEECRALGVDILLGPGMNMQRLSVGGRNFEYMGEDPILTAAIGTAFISKLQEGGVVATPKHFIGNDQDFCRHIANSAIDERTLREIYLYPWEKAITQAGTLAMMTGNNLINGTHNALNKAVLTDILRREFGFKGFIMTDWQSTNYYPELQRLLLVSGHNLLMPQNDTFVSFVRNAIEQDPQRRPEIELFLEVMIFPTLNSLFRMGVYDRPTSLPGKIAEIDYHKGVALAVALESPVLLKNEKNILPLKSGQKVLLTGTEEVYSGSGSGLVKGFDHVSIETGLRQEFGEALTCVEKAPAALVRKADVVLFRLNKPSGEGFDIPFEAPADQLAELRRVAGLNKNVVVLVSSCNGLPTDWAKDVRGVVWLYFLGQERGSAVAKLLSGRENFSGKLPFTLERRFADSPAPEFNFIGGKPFWKGNNEYKNYWLLGKDVKVEGFSDFVEPGEILQVPYSEGVFVGYRWYDKKEIPVAYPFGYGLSYTKFSYEGISVEDRMESDGLVKVSVKVRNAGLVAGKETVQVYVADPVCSVERPVKELRAFEKVDLAPGETRTVELCLDKRAFCFWDVRTHSWVAERGEFIISAGGSSASLPLKETVELF